MLAIELVHAIEAATGVPCDVATAAWIESLGPEATAADAWERSEDASWLVYVAEVGGRVGALSLAAHLAIEEQCRLCRVDGWLAVKASTLTSTVEDVIPYIAERSVCGRAAVELDAWDEWETICRNISRRMARDIRKAIPWTMVESALLASAKEAA